MLMTSRSLFTSLLLLVAAIKPVSAAPSQSLPSGLGEITVYLPANSKGAENSQLPAVPGELLRHTAEEISLSDPNTLALKKKGFAKSEAILRYPVQAPISPGQYAVWTRFGQGGGSEQSFRLALGDGTKESEERLVFSQSAKSWDVQWRKAPKTLLIYPGDQTLEISVTGVATEQKLLGGFLLEKIGDLPAGLTPEAAVARTKFAQTFNAGKPDARLLILEGKSAEDLNAVYEAFLAAPNPGLKLAAESLFGAQAENLRSTLGLPPAACVLLVGQNQSVRQIWQGPFDKAGAAAMLAEISNPSQLTAPVAPSSPNSAPTPTALRDGRPSAWLTAGTWAGPGGLSLWGLDYESAIRPNPQDPTVITRFDSSPHGRWKAEELVEDSRYGNTPSDVDYVWARGVLYAHLYVHAEAATTVVLHIAQTGVATSGWLNGQPLSFASDASQGAESPLLTKAGKATTLDRTDQGAIMTVTSGPAEPPQAATLALKAGWNRILLKLISQTKKGETFSFKTRFTGEDGQAPAGLKTSLADPTPTAISREIAAQMIPLVRTNAPFNLVHEGEPLSLTVDLGSVNYRTVGQPDAELVPYIPFSGSLELIVTDYDGKEILRRSATGIFPGEAAFDLGTAPARGYYATQLTLFDKDNNLVAVYPSDGFSVIGGTAAQADRKEKKKMAVTYYFMADANKGKTLYFPYMQRMGIFRNIGGSPLNEKAIALYRLAAAEGMLLSGDLWNYRDPAFIETHVQEVALLVDSFKSYNEIDIHPPIRGTPESWVNKIKLDYETVKNNAPSALVVGGSLVRPGADDWFEGCLKLGLDKYQDVWDVHCYPKNPPELEGSMTNSDNEAELGVLKVMKKLGMKNTKPFWIGETGARCSHGLDARRWQADTVAKMVACALSRPDFLKIGFLVPWWYSRELGKISDIEVGHMPAEAAYYTASALVDGFDYTRLHLGDSVQAAKFGPTIMAWTTADAPREVSLTPEGNAPFVQIDVVGRLKELPSQDKKTVSVTLTQSPVYILSRETYDRLTGFESN